MNGRSVTLLPHWEELVRISRRACEEAARAARGDLFATALPSPPVSALEAASAALRTHLAQSMFYYSFADHRESFFGLGAARRFSASGEDRVQAVADWWRQELKTCPTVGADVPWPVALGGFAFGSGTSSHWPGFPPALFVLPELLIAQRGGETSLILCGSVNSPSSPADRLQELLSGLTDSKPSARDPREPLRAGQDEFRALVARATAAISEGTFEKVVLARSATVPAVSGADAADALRYLHDHQPGCRVFAVQQSGAIFLGASPERLARVVDGAAFVDCLAGSAARGTDPTTDDRLASRLLESPKNLQEHRHVVSEVTGNLRALGLQLDVPGRPGVVRLSEVQHLHTPVRAALPAGMGVLDLASVLHPTPAVGGLPRDAALSWLATNSGLERGWYGGAVGWAGAGGDGELSVAIRSGLIADGSAELFAGNGIVAGSDPDEEYRETEIKLLPMLRALGVLA